MSGRYHILFAIFILSCVAVTAAGASDEPPTSGTLTVGVIAPLTGPLAEYGLAARNGIELARDQRKDIFSKINFIYEDSQWDAKSSVAAFNKLRAVSKVSLIFNWGNPTTEAIAPLAEQLKFPVVGMTLDPAVARNKSYVIRATNPDSDFADTLAKYLIRQRYAKIGVVLAQNTYVQGLLDGLRSHLGGNQKVEIIDSYPINATDFRASVTKAKSGKYDAIGVFLISGQVSTFYRQLQQQDVKLPTFGTDFFESSTEINLANGGMEGAVYSHLAVTPEFESAYVERFKNDYQLAYAGNAYDIAVLIGTELNPLNTVPDAARIIELLQLAPPINGVTGSFQYRRSEDGDSYFGFPVKLKKIKNGKITNLPQ